MLRSLRLFWISIALIWIQHNDIGRCFDDSDENNGDDELLNNSPDTLFGTLDSYMDGITHFPSMFPRRYRLDNGWCNPNEYCIRFHPNMRTCLRGKILVGSMISFNQIDSVTLAFYDIDENILRDDSGQLLQYTSVPQDLGHLLDIASSTLYYSYAKFIFRLLSSENFDWTSIFFHFARRTRSISTSSTTTIEPDFTTANITGPSIVYVDFHPQNYTISMPCPSHWFCFWLLDGASISIDASTNVTITFRPHQIGTRTLVYATFVGWNYTNLSSYSITVYPLLATAVLLQPSISDMEGLWDIIAGVNVTLIHGLWNTTAGGNSTLSSAGSGPGNYSPEETPSGLFVNNSTSKYTSYGPCNVTVSVMSMTCGLNTGFYVTLQPNPSLLIAFRFRTGNNLPERDPLAITIEGSDQHSSALQFGSSWTLIYTGPTGLDNDPGRETFGTTESLSNNSLWFKSYRILVTQKRNVSNAVQYADVELFGYKY